MSMRMTTTMRCSLLAGFATLLLAGCTPPTTSAPAQKPEPREPTTTKAIASQETAAEKPATEPTVADTAASDEELPPNLWTRGEGVDWPCFLGPTGDSRSPETGLLTNWPKAGPKIVWQREIGTSYGIGSISRGRMFQFDRYDNQARLTCLNSETGQELWRFEYRASYEDLYDYNNGPRCSPVVDGNRVYIFGVEGMLHCVNARDGELLWKVDTAKEFGVVQNFFGVGSTPVVEGGLLIVMVGGSPPAAQAVAPGRLDRVTGSGSGIVAFDKLTGKVRYKITDELASYASLKLATIDDRRWCFAFCRGGLVGFEPATGKVDFTYPWRAKSLESVNASMPVVVGDEVFISETYGIGSSLLKVEPGRHEVVWADDPRVRAKAMLCHWNTPICIDGYLYGCSGRNAPVDLRCIEWKTGKVMWTAPHRPRSSLLYFDGHFVCLEEDGHLMLLKANPEKFDVVSEVVLKAPATDPPTPDAQRRDLLIEPCWAAPILSHGLLYVRGNDRLVCLELRP